ncbi:MAG: LytTR family DNA-binding domain-containing protein [Cyclobacteriaceae bacterium]|nr:LytTR family DNA-binding domain-containing protein [Cyclobacteriaceae bacterium]
MKIVILEDELMASKRLRSIVGKLEPTAEILEVLDSVESAVAWFKEHPMPQLIFMDIQLADGISFEIFNQVTITAPVIFTTAYDEYTLKAFKVNSIDYLLKPLKSEEVRQSLKKFRDLNQNSNVIDYQQLALALENQTTPRQQRIVVKYGQHIEAIDLGKAAYFYTEEKIVFMRTLEGKRFALDYTLEELAQMLDPKKFFRINRQFVVSIDAIEKMYQYSKSRVKLMLKPPMNIDTIVSTDRSSNFKKWLAGS